MRAENQFAKQVPPMLHVYGVLLTGSRDVSLLRWSRRTGDYAARVEGGLKGPLECAGLFVVSCPFKEMIWVNRIPRGA